jgi:uncharacterized protein (DUF608 family)
MKFYRRCLVLVLFYGILSCLAFSFTAIDEVQGEEASEVQHFVPVEKNLSAPWIASLYDRGNRRIYQGKELEKIGMPICGIATGQLYLCGDGTLAHWEIFNHHKFSGYGATNYLQQSLKKPVDQGFAVLTKRGNDVTVKRLNSRDFADVQFIGEYPIGWVTYRDKNLPVSVEMEAFSPYIPLNAQDSALPATVFHITVKNESNQPVETSVLGWLENAVGINSASNGLYANRRSRIVNEIAGPAYMVHSIEEKPQRTESKRRPIIFEDFEGPDYGDWKVEGQAFGRQPAKGTLPTQQSVSGFLGKGLVNTFLSGDDPHGTLTSPEFTMERNCINFLIGGGSHAGRTCMNLLIEDKVVRSAHGRDIEKLEWRCWEVSEFQGKKARLQVVDKYSGGWGHINIDQIEFADDPKTVAVLTDNLPDDGTMVLMAANPDTVKYPDPILGKIQQKIGDLNFDPDITYTVQQKKSTGLGTSWKTLPPKAKVSFTYVLSWHFPNHPHGHEYNNRFTDAAQVAHYILDNHKRLSGQTHLWHDTLYDSTLPYWLLDRLHSTVSNLATGTTQWWQSGRFWAWEGVQCCAGTCTHVWNYAHAAARLFPQLERSAREMQDFGEGFDPRSGLVGFRSNRAYAADGQCGTILKAYREHQMSANDSFLRKNWPKIKKALEYSITQDGNDDGLIENSQHNTFDINFFGANTFVGSLYLAALRAGEEMAREVGDPEFAQRCRKIFEGGKRLTSEKLWNGEYFIQDVDLTQHPKFQYDGGCLSDQIFGQGWAHHVGLGYLYPSDQVQQALRSVWKYNWAPDIEPQNRVHKPERWFAQPKEAGLFTCTWPKTKYLKAGVRYKNEVWTGIEYQVAGNMIWEGMIDEGLSICRAIHDRYHPLKRNPWNEVECGDHYARALASWGVYTALAGFEYHGPKGHLGFVPRMTPNEFRSAFTTAQAWGTFSQKRNHDSQTNTITLRWGKHDMNTLALAVPKNMRKPTVSVYLSGNPVKQKYTYQDNRILIAFPQELKIEKGQTLNIEITAGG